MTNLRRYVAGALCGAFAVLLLLSAAAQAQSACAPVDRIISQLQGPKYGEVLFFTASVRTAQGQIPVQFYANARTGTWTMLTMPAAGIACIAAAGDSFAPPPRKGRSAKWSTR